MNAVIQKTISRKTLTILFILIVAIAGTSFFYQQKKEWEAPASADTKKNPIKTDAPTIAAGKTLYVTECLSCHGKKGKGDGPAAVQLDVPAGDFTKPMFQKHTDGGLFWKVSEGRKPMPSFKKKLNENQIWQLVVYMRTIK